MGGALAPDFGSTKKKTFFLLFLSVPLHPKIFGPSVGTKVRHNKSQIRKQMRLGTYLYYEKTILGSGLWAGLDCEKKVWADYEQLLRPRFFIFHVFFSKYCRVRTEKLH